MYFEKYDLLITMIMIRERKTKMIKWGCRHPCSQPSVIDSVRYCSSCLFLIQGRAGGKRPISRSPSPRRSPPRSPPLKKKDDDDYDENDIVLAPATPPRRLRGKDVESIVFNPKNVKWVFAQLERKNPLYLTLPVLRIILSHFESLAYTSITGDEYDPRETKVLAIACDAYRERSIEKAMEEKVKHVSVPSRLSYNCTGSPITWSIVHTRAQEEEEEEEEVPWMRTPPRNNANDDDNDVPPTVIKEKEEEEEDVVELPVVVKKKKKTRTYSRKL
jgi:hypothetical protein